MRDFKSLEVWKRAHGLVLALYQATRGFPRDEEFGLTRQIRRAGASVPANIAEGCGRGSQREFAQYLQVSIGSANELEYHLLLARDLGFLSGDVHIALEREVAGVRRMLSGLLGQVRIAGSR
ncbi:MAG: four helix bundle protein [Anaerolineales bacterium]